MSDLGSELESGSRSERDTPGRRDLGHDITGPGGDALQSIYQGYF